MSSVPYSTGSPGLPFRLTMTERSKDPSTEENEMSRAFTHYWTGETVSEQEEGAPLEHTADNRFRKSGVQTGDTVYVVNVRQGVLYLIGRMEVGRYADSIEEVQELLGYEPWEAADHLLAAPGTATRQSRNRRVPDAITRRLLFDTLKGDRGLVFLPDGKLDPQTLRGVRRLTRRSADLLDDLLDE